jgi:hypothetical protein
MNKYVYGSLVIAMVAVLGMGAVFATGPNGFGNGFMKSDLTDEEKLVMQEQKETYQTAVESEDYATWEALMLEKVGFMEDQITQENFDEIVVRHAERAEFRMAVDELKASDDFSREAMQELKTQYGIEDKGFGKMHGGSEKGIRGSGSRKGSCPFAE